MLARQGQDMSAARPAEGVRQAQIHLIPNPQDQGFQESTALPSRSGQGGAQLLPEPGPELRPPGPEAEGVHIPVPGKEDPAGSFAVRDRIASNPDPEARRNRRTRAVDEYREPSGCGNPDVGSRPRRLEGQDEHTPPGSKGRRILGGCPLDPSHGPRGQS